jgi:hypothetical protein
MALDDEIRAMEERVETARSIAYEAMRKNFYSAKYAYHCIKEDERYKKGWKDDIGDYKFLTEAQIEEHTELIQLANQNIIAIFKLCCEEDKIFLCDEFGFLECDVLENEWDTFHITMIMDDV